MTEVEALEHLYNLHLHVALFLVAVFGLLSGWFISGR